MKSSPERWKPVKGWPYEVSSRGQIRSLPREVAARNQYGAEFTRVVKSRILRQSTINGYLHVNLSRDNKVKKFKVHRLVAKAFLPNPEKLPHVLHWDDNRTNNRVKNLRWGTHEDNMQDRAAAGFKGAFAILSDKDIANIRKLLKSGLRQKDIGARYGVSQSAISKIAVGKTWTDV